MAASSPDEAAQPLGPSDAFAAACRALDQYEAAIGIVAGTAHLDALRAELDAVLEALEAGQPLPTPAGRGSSPARAKSR
jgi:hypothetical protein